MDNVNVCKLVSERQEEMKAFLRGCVPEGRAIALLRRCQRRRALSSNPLRKRASKGVQGVAVWHAKRMKMSGGVAIRSNRGVSRPSWRAAQRHGIVHDATQNHIVFKCTMLDTLHFLSEDDNAALQKVQDAKQGVLCTNILNGTTPTAVAMWVISDTTVFCIAPSHCKEISGLPGVPIVGCLWAFRRKLYLKKEVSCMHASAGLLFGEKSAKGRGEVQCYTTRGVRKVTYMMWEVEGVAWLLSTHGEMQRGVEVPFARTSALWRRVSRSMLVVGVKEWEENCLHAMDQVPQPGRLPFLPAAFSVHEGGACYESYVRLAERVAQGMTPVRMVVTPKEGGSFRDSPGGYLCISPTQIVGVVLKAVFSLSLGRPIAIAMVFVPERGERQSSLLYYHSGRSFAVTASELY